MKRQANRCIDFRNLDGMDGVGRCTLPRARNSESLSAERIRIDVARRAVERRSGKENERASPCGETFLARVSEAFACANDIRRKMFSRAVMARLQEAGAAQRRAIERCCSGALTGPAGRISRGRGSVTTDRGDRVLEFARVFAKRAPKDVDWNCTNCSSKRSAVSACGRMTVAGVKDSLAWIARGGGPASSGMAGNNGGAASVSEEINRNRRWSSRARGRTARAFALLAGRTSGDSSQASAAPEAEFGDSDAGEFEPESCARRHSRIQRAIRASISTPIHWSAIWRSSFRRFAHRFRRDSSNPSSAVCELVTKYSSGSWSEPMSGLQIERSRRRRDASTSDDARYYSYCHINTLYRNVTARITEQASRESHQAFCGTACGRLGRRG